MLPIVLRLGSGEMTDIVGLLGNLIVKNSKLRQKKDCPMKRQPFLFLLFFQGRVLFAAKSSPSTTEM